MPRLYREAPLMGIWEGSGNVSALDTLRAMATRPECVEVFFDELSATSGHDSRLDAHVANLSESLADLQTIEYRGRKVAGDISLALQGSAARSARSSSGGGGVPGYPDGVGLGRCFGTLPTGLDLSPILERALVKG